MNPAARDEEAAGLELAPPEAEPVLDAATAEDETPVTCSDTRQRGSSETV